MMVAREFGATVIGLSDKSELKLAALIEKHDPHAETVRFLSDAIEHIEGREQDEGAHGMTAWEHGFIRDARAHLAALKEGNK